MTQQVTHAVWLNDTQTCSIADLSEASGLSVDDIEDLVDSGVLRPVPAPQRCFALLHVVTVRQARRLRDDFELDRNGLALAMTLLQRIQALEQALRAAHPQHGGPAAPHADGDDESER